MRPRFEIEVLDLAAHQMEWLRQEWQIDFSERAIELLSLDPRPHRTRRILEVEPGLLRMACGPWRLYYRIEGLTVRVERVDKGYASETLMTPGYEKIIDREAQIEFSKRWNSLTT